MICQVETEQVLPAEAREQEEVWAEVAAEVEWAATVRAQVPEEIAYVLIANYPYRIKWAFLVIT